MTNPKKTIKPAPQQAKEVTKEQVIAVAARNFSQKYQSIAEAVLFNLCHRLESVDSVEIEVIAHHAIEITDDFMERIGPACDAAFDRIVRPKFDEKPEE